MMRKNGKSKKTGIFGLRNKIYLCFLVPIVFMIVVGMVSYRYAEDGLSQIYGIHPADGQYGNRLYGCQLFRSQIRCAAVCL